MTCRWKVLIAGAAGCLSLPLCAQTVVIRPDATGLFRIEAIVNERVKVRALIDTGATTFVLCDSTASELALALGSTVNLETASGVVQGWRASIDTLRIGTITIHRVQAVVYARGCVEAMLGVAPLSRLGAVVLRAGTLRLVKNRSGPLSRRKHPPLSRVR
jgi:clan AA aspartic protease (TIGR02281 family)